jgi:hypothetical protein
LRLDKPGELRRVSTLKVHDRLHNIT